MTPGREGWRARLKEQLSRQDWPAGWDRPDDNTDTGEGRDEMANDMAAEEFYEPAEYAVPDVPGRFDISGYRNGLFGGHGADLFGQPGVPEDHQPGYPQAGYPQREWAEEPVAPQAPAETPPPDPVTETGSLVRPYTRTGGRTRPDYELAIEALVTTSERGWDPEADEMLLPEYRSIRELCVDQPLSVAEVAAYVRLPLGVVRVLIGDMAGMGFLIVHATGTAVGDRPSMEFLERVLSGLRRL
ncbi:MAG TPA: DUF742 domain-containing protein [Pseudonocardiaceae bacterium]|jgi:hypothetical protein|nr:DUF742 domain-containing protein [Pseudonocardiaceae bacterium]